LNEMLPLVWIIYLQDSMYQSGGDIVVEVMNDRK